MELLAVNISLHDFAVTTLQYKTLCCISCPTVDALTTEM